MRIVKAAKKELLSVAVKKRTSGKEKEMGVPNAVIIEVTGLSSEEIDEL